MRIGPAAAACRAPASLGPRRQTSSAVALECTDTLLALTQPAIGHAMQHGHVVDVRRQSQAEWRLAG